ncbi:hypothetical protein H6F43_00210 [Leptolyngbya sp. FACHB-36]|uniref:hypothetical protein n=1 Tax=Leptolyngbya sp. FACHB-36 TaxID=2692808 RepID=UPI0016805293|nr:hypothetical protein [Leptolyngbya sp. FACHB-36]MBD2018606.1 hypothetical protein [Leptolyngbya sp. FACHB-36]
MTVSDDFIPGDSYDAGPNYPVVFGIALTPIVSGVLLALAGLGIAAYLFTSLVQPEWQRNQELDAQVRDKNNQLAQQAAIKQQIEKARTDLNAATRQRDEVLALFANEASLDTLPIDLSRQVGTPSPREFQRQENARFAACPANVRANRADFKQQFGDLVIKPQIRQLTPIAGATGVINDSSYGALVNGKLKREAATFSFEGDFNQTQAILRRIERLQPLLVLKNADINVGGQGSRPATPYYQLRGNTFQLVPNCQPETKITSTFQLEALAPLTPEESKANQPATLPPPKQ